MNKVVTMKVDSEGKKTLKRLAADLDCNMIKLTRDLKDYEEDIKKLLERGK